MESITANYRRQHRELLEAAGVLKALLRHDSLAKDAAPARRALIVLSGKLKVHLAMEDQSMYPILLEHRDPAVSGMARRFADEMGGIREAFLTYVEKWSTAEAIQNDSGGFIRETGGIFDALKRRIEREDNELYPMVDLIGLG